MKPILFILLFVSQVSSSAAGIYKIPVSTSNQSEVGCEALLGKHTITNLISDRVRHAAILAAVKFEKQGKPHEWIEAQLRWSAYNNPILREASVLFNQKWVEWVKSQAGLPRYGSIEHPLELSRPETGTFSEVFIFMHNGRRWVFRPIDGYSSKSDESMLFENSFVGRRTYLASLKNQDAGLHTVARVHLGWVNDSAGVISEFIEGDTLDSHYSKKVKVNPQSIEDAAAFEFWVANIDANVDHSNLKLDLNGNLFSLDHEKAHSPGLARYSEKSLGQLASWLPHNYNKSFLKFLRNHSEEKLREKYVLHETPEEHDGSIFRRQVILIDADRPH